MIALYFLRYSQYTSMHIRRYTHIADWRSVHSIISVLG